MKRASAIGVALFAGALVVTQNWKTVQAAQTAKTIDITAKRFAFEPNYVALKKGETVTIRIHSEDVVHGLFVRPLKIDTDIEPGKSTELTVTPQTAGKFTAICDHFCGVNHGAMKMTFEVTE